MRELDKTTKQVVQEGDRFSKLEIQKMFLKITITDILGMNSLFYK